VNADVRDASALIDTIGKYEVDEVVHFAGVVSVEESVTKPAFYFSNNVGATAILTEACANTGVSRLVFSSTAAVYGEPTSNKVSETHATAPHSPYGQSKLLAEEIIRSAAPATDLRFGILRYFNVAGADPDGRGGQINPGSRHLIRNAMRAAKGEIPHFEIFGDDYDTPDGTGVRDFVHVADLADVHLSTLEYLRRGGESIVLNCGYGTGFSVLSVVDVVKRVTGVDFPVRRTSRRPGDVASVIADTTRAQAALAWTPRLNDLTQMVEHAWRWELARNTASRALS
jgi:UDP-glucose 4-epimerase